ncbi:hypothetical protein FKM82_019687, partial [Ascaphus truei]
MLSCGYADGRLFLSSGAVHDEATEVGQVTRKKKKKSKRPEPAPQQSEDSRVPNGLGHATQDAGSAAVFVWDSQIRDGYKRAPCTPSVQAPAAPTAPAWDGTKESLVVQELLRNAKDKAYGTQ